MKKIPVIRCCQIVGSDRPDLGSNVAQTSLVHKKESSAYGHHDTVDDEARKDRRKIRVGTARRQSRTKNSVGCSRLNDILLGIWMSFLLGICDPRSTVSPWQAI